MVKGMSIVTALLCSIGFSQSISAITVEGSTWTLGKKTIVFREEIELQEQEITFLCSVHLPKEEEHQWVWESAERTQLEAVVTAIKKYLQENSKKLHLLVEEFDDALGARCVLSGLRKRLEEEGLISQVIFENIELRKAYAMVEGLLRNYPDKPYKRDSIPDKFSPDQVTLQDVLTEFDTILTQLQAYHSAAVDYGLPYEAVTEIHNEEMAIITSYLSELKNILENNKIPCNERLFSLLQKSPENLALYQSLRYPMFHAARCFVDLYAFYRVLALPTKEKLLFIAGGDHCSFVTSQIMGSLGAECKSRFGKGYRLEGEPRTLLNSEQIKTLICA